MSTLLCRADTLGREMPEARADKAKAKTILAAIVRLFAVLLATLQEIFDESAYQRFLNRSHLRSSPMAYAAFRKETEQVKSQRPRCC
jgi:hypothetical protein